MIMLILDHEPVTFMLNLCELLLQRLWRMDPQLVNDLFFYEYLNGQMTLLNI